MIVHPDGSSHVARPHSPTMPDPESIRIPVRDALEMIASFDSIKRSAPHVGEKCDRLKKFIGDAIDRLDNPSGPTRG